MYSAHALHYVKEERKFVKCHGVIIMFVFYLKYLKSRIVKALQYLQSNRLVVGLFVSISGYVCIYLSVQVCVWVCSFFSLVGEDILNILGKVMVVGCSGAAV